MDGHIDHVMQDQAFSSKMKKHEVVKRIWDKQRQKTRKNTGCGFPQMEISNEGL